MSEEEILRRIHLLIAIHDDLITDKDRQALQEILDLYNKEKEKNEILKDKIRKIVKKINGEVDWLYEYEGSWNYCKPFDTISKKLTKMIDNKR